MLQDGILVLALVVDAFLACFAYGVEEIEIPLGSACLMGAIGTGVLLLSMLATAPLRQVLPPRLTTVAGSAILFGIGLLSAFQNSLKAFLSKKRNARGRMRFHWAGISFAITVYLDETQADADHSKRLSLREAAMLGCVLSLDSLAIGFGSGLGQHNYLFLGLFSLLLHPLAILLAYRLGKGAAGKLPAGCGAAGGILLMVLAISKLC
mgnify:FL=1